MATLTTYGSTVFKFNRSEKKWKEKGSGDVTFSLKGDQLIVSVGKLSFIVQGGVRPKGSKAIVMRGKEMRQENSGDAIILAVRFERERDSRNLFTMLSCTPWIRPQRSRTGRSKGQRRSTGSKRPPPAWFLGMGTREQENVRALVSNAQVAYLEDGTIQRQLGTVYKLTPSQIEDAIDYFQPWLRLSKEPRNHYRVSSFSIGTRTDVSSLPSIHTAKLLPNAAYASPSTPARPGANLQAPVAPMRVRSPKVHDDKKANQPAYPEYPKPAPDSPKKEAVPAGAARSPNNMKSPTGQYPPSPKSGNKPAVKPSTPPKPASPDQNNSGYSDPKPRTKPGSGLPIIDERTAPLTTQNLMLHNKIHQPIKGDFRTNVSSWLRKTHGEGAD